MVKLTRIYTRGGDKGKTSLGDGERRDKHDPRVAAFGTVDEANALLGMAGLHAEGEIAGILSRIQNDLFDLGADLCTPEKEAPKHPPLRIVATQTERLEKEIDRFNVELAPLNSFILPGGSALSAQLQVARTVVRRAEREITLLASQEPGINPEALRYINRLSDLLFVLARWANDRGRADPLWVPGANR